MSNTITQYMVAADASPDNDFASHSVGVDSAVGLHVIDGYGNELDFSREVQESIYEALGEFLKSRVELSTPSN